jgi:RNA polymerase sigma-70 factor, ECF subfamily
MVDELIRRCQEGDRAAIIDLIESHSDFIQKVAFKITRNTELQKDIFQEVVRLVLCNIRSFRGECAFTTWLFRIVSNASLGQIKWETGSRKQVDFATVEDLLVDHTNSQLERMEQNEQFLVVRKALVALPKLEREILSLFYFGELSIDEVAAVVGKTPGAVKAALFKGRQRIIKNLRKQEITEHVAM